MKPKISIIVPVYNVEEYLDKCISSILNQTFKDFELILVNDGSSDRSGEICDRYAINDNRVKLIHKDNSGQATSRNIGLKISNADLIGFVDSDDSIEPDMYELLYESYLKYDSDISIIGVKEVDKSGKCLSEYVPQNITLSEILKRAYPCNKLFKRELFFNNNLFFKDNRYYEDLELIPKLYVNSRKIKVISKVGYVYLKRANSTTSGRDKKILDNLWAYTEIKQYLYDQGLYDLYSEEFKKGVAYFKTYFINLLYDYPTTFIMENFKVINNDFNKIGGIEKKEYVVFFSKHINFKVRECGSRFKFITRNILK